MFLRLSIRTKITAIVSLLLLALAGMGAFAVQNMSSINASTVDISTNWLPSMRALGDVRAATLAYRSVVRGYLLAEDEAERTAIEKSMIGYQDNLAKALKAYEPLVSSEEEHAYLREFSKLSGEYRSGVDQVLALVHNSQDKAARELNRKVNLIGVKTDELLQKAVSLNNAGALAANDRAAATYDLAFKAVLGLLGIAVVVGFGAAFLVVRNVTTGIASIVAPMQSLGKGDLTAAVPHQGEKTEIGAMADALQVFKQALIDKRDADAAAAADAEEKIRRGERVNAITKSFENMIGEIVEMVSSASIELEAAAGTLTATAAHSQQLSAVVASASSEASCNVQSVASATEELTSSVNEISRQVQQSAGIAGEAVEQARATNHRIGELAKAASRIGDVVELINTIAGQTNLLALNATIEAARAGEAGRGFAVVASEVKALAEQTARATGEISQHISGMQTATDESVDAIREIGDTISRMSEISSAIASAVEEQGAATQEIARNVQHAAHGTSQVSSNIADVERGATETGSASSQVLAAAQSLSSESTRLKTEVGKFLDAVRAA